MALNLMPKTPIQHKLVKAKPKAKPLVIIDKEKLKTKVRPIERAIVNELNQKLIEKTIPEKPKAKAIEKPLGNIFGINPNTDMLITDIGRITKAGFILEFHKLRAGYCLKLYDEIRSLLDTKAFMMSEKVHYDFLLKSFDKVCLSIYAKKDKLSIPEMKKAIQKTMADIQSNIVSNIILILPD
jgi:hypothetical protein